MTLSQKISENKNLTKALKEKEERIISLENEIKLKEQEEKRLERGKITESGVVNELKDSEIGNEYIDANDLGQSQNDLIKENERLKDEIMILKKDLILAKENMNKSGVSKEEYEKIKSENSSLKYELNEEKIKNSKNIEEINQLKKGIISSLSLSDKNK